MWVYQQSDKPENELAAGTSFEPEVALVFSDERQLPSKSVSEIHDKSSGPVQPEMAAAEFPRNARKEPRARGQATRDCIFLAAAYLFGTTLAGITHALLQAAELNLLEYYLDHWLSLFSVDGPARILGLFAVQYFTVVGAVTALLVLGLCAFGPVLIYLFTMLYGFGVGLIGMQLFFRLSWGGFLGYLLLAGLPAAGIAVCLCFFGASALRVSSRLQRAAFGRRDRLGVSCGARLLLGQYLLFDVVLLPLCGLATGLACLANRLGGI